MNPEELAESIDTHATLKAAEELGDSGLIMLSYDGMARLYKDETEEIESKGYRVSGITYDSEDGDVTGVNLWFRPDN